jgi:hypothetical protein
MKIYVCTNFTGHWPVGSAALVIAEDSEEAERMLRDVLAEEIPQRTQPPKLWMDEVKPDSKGVTLLNDGNY